MQQILEIKHRLDGERVTYPATLLDRGPGFAAILYVLPRETAVEDLRLPPGTLTVAYYWEDRPYNLYHWIDPRGSTLAFYFNLSRGTAVRDREVEWHDLAVDVLVTPDGTARVLDEHEVPPDLPAEVREAVSSAREAVLRDMADLWETIEPASRRYLAAARRAGP